MVEEPRRGEEQDARPEANQALDFRALFEGVMRFLPEGITIAEAPDVRVIAVSDFGQHLLGRDNAVLIGTGVEDRASTWQIYRPESGRLAEAAELPLTRAIRAGEVILDEPWLIRRPDGTELHLLCNAGPIRGADGAIRWGVAAWRDVTASRRAEDALRASEARLRRAEEIGGIGDWEWDLADNGAIWSPSLYRLLGVDPETYVPTGTSIFDFLHPEDEARVRQAVRDTLERNRPIDIDFRIVRPDGEVRWLASRGGLERNGKGAGRRLVGVNFDITDRKAAEASLHDKRRRLFEYKDTLLQESNHRIKNNLTVAAALLRMQARSADTGAAESQLHESADRIIALGQLYDQLAQAGAHEVDAAAYLSGLGTTLAQSMQRPGTGITVQVKADACLLPVTVATDLGLIFNELVTNACKHGQGKDGSCEVTVRFGAVGNEAVMSVEDRGPGLPAGFDIAGSKSLGLRLVSILAANLGGSFSAASATCGARFELRFPLAREPADDALGSFAEASERPPRAEPASRRRPAGGAA